MLDRLRATPPRLLAYKALGRARRRWRAATVPTRPLRLTDAQLRARLRVPYPDDAALLATARASRAPFHLRPDDRAADLAALDATWPDERGRLVAAAEAIAAEPLPDWHLDRHAGHRWPLVHFSAVDYLDLDRPSDVKHVWNLSRQHELVTLGQARWLTGQERFAEVAFRRLDSWIEANPVEMGVNWTVAMEAAQRLASWGWARALLVDSPALTPARLRRWIESVWHHARYVEENLEFTRRSGNHLLADAIGLVYAGAAFPELAGAARWRESGWGLLGQQILAQTYPDGVDYEGSSSYHRMVLEFGLDGLLLAARSRRRLPFAVDERLAAMAAVSRALTGADGLGPMLGDADDGFLWRLTERQTDDHRPAIALAAAALGAPRRDEPPPPELLWLLGPAGLARYQAAPLEPAGGDRVFPLGGLYRIGGRDQSALVDCGQLGMGPGGHGGHGHLDCLSLVAEDAGGPILVDPGTYVYTGDVAARRAFRATSAHNTVVVDGADQAEQIGPWSLDNRLQPTLELWHAGARFALVDASHSGYQRLPDPVTHRRQVVHARGHYWLIVDHLLGRADHLVERSFHFPPGARAELVGERLRLERPGGAVAWLAWPGPDPARPADLAAAVVDGWVSRGYGRRAPAPVLVQRARAALPLVLPIVLSPGPAEVRVVADGQRGWRIERGGQVDRLELAGPELTLRLADGARLIARPPEGAREEPVPGSGP